MLVLLGCLIEVIDIFDFVIFVLCLGCESYEEMLV